MSASSFATVNPSTGEPIESFSFYNADEIEKTLALGEKSFRDFRKQSVYKRSELLARLALSLRKNKAQLAKVITTEMGKVTAEAEAEIEKCAHEAEWYAEHGPRIMADEPAATGVVNAYVSYLPLGAILDRDAMELSNLAVDAHGHPHLVGRQCCLGEAFKKHPA